MTLAEVLGDESLRRREFPVARDRIFLSHAAVCPLPARVAGAIQDYASRCATGDQETIFPGSQIRGARERAAQLLGASPDEIAFVGPTSLGLSQVASGLPFRKGDNVVIYLDDYPSNVYPWMALADRGVEVRLIRVRELGQIRTEDVLGQVDEQTRLTALASCHFISGYRIDLATLGQRLHEKGVLFCVDAIQTLGAFPTRVEHIDFLAADSHKWLLGPCAAGLLYVSRSLQERLKPAAFGWHNVRCPDFIAQERMVLRTGARRYEAGTQNLLGLAGLDAAISLLLEIGVETIAAELLRKRSWLIPALMARGYTVLQADAPPLNAGGIVTFHRASTDMAALHAKLETAGVCTSLRKDRSGRQYVRLSPHFYNTDEELGRVLELL